MDKKISRVERSRSEARENYNRLSRWYDLISGSSEERFREIGVEVLDLQNGERVLEIGFGTGHCLTKLAEAAGEKGRVVGIDLSDGMVKIAKQRISQNRLREEIDLCLADGANLPFCADHFEAIFISFTLELFDTPEIPRVLEQCREVLQPSGRLVNVSLSKTSPPGLVERIYEWFHVRMPVLIDCRPIEARQAIEDAGFKIEMRKCLKMWGLTVDVISACETSR